MACNKNVACTGSLRFLAVSNLVLLYTAMLYGKRASGKISPPPSSYQLYNSCNCPRIAIWDRLRLTILNDDTGEEDGSLVAGNETS